MATFLSPAQDNLVRTYFAQHLKKWVVQYKLYRNAVTPKTLEFLKQNINPSMLACVDEATMIDAEPELEDIIVRTKLWNFRQSFTIEGSIYEVGSFKVAIANVLQKSVWKGILFHVTYDGTESVDLARPIIQEFFLKCFLQNNKSVTPVYESFFNQPRHSLDSKLLLQLFKQRIDTVSQRT